MATQIKFGEHYIVLFTAGRDTKLYFVNSIYRTNVHEISSHYYCIKKNYIFSVGCYYNPYPTAFPYGNGMVLHFYQQQESSTTKTVHKVINKGHETYVLV